MKRIMKHISARLKDRLVPFRGAQHFLHENVLYFCQWESRVLAKDFLSGEKSAIDDPLWENSGAKTREEYSDWSWACCGMACLKMVLAHKYDNIVPLVTLGKRCMEYGGYKLPLAESAGLYYKPFTEFVEKEYNLHAEVLSPLTVTGILEALSDGKYIIASVNPAIRHPESPTPKTKSGHLILLLGYDLTSKKFSFHNPSGDTKENQEYASLSFRDFKRFFSGRGIAIG
jgi:hypothetical protein